MSCFYGTFGFKKDIPGFSSNLHPHNEKADESSVFYNDTFFCASLAKDEPKDPVCDGIYISKQKDLVLLCTGYIYNHEFLRKKLNAADHSSDLPLAEVICALYREQGMEWVQDINGQFSFVLCDMKRRQAFLGVDRPGIYNLYYSLVDGALVFASDIKFILQYPNIEKKLDLKALEQMMTFCSIVSPSTIVKSIKSVSGGTYVKFSQESTEPVVYWDLYFPEKKDRQALFSEEECISRFEDVFDRALQNKTDACRSNGVLLSGGLDSSVVAAGLRRLRPASEMYTFSLDYTFSNLSEKRYQELMVNELGSRHSVREFGLREFSDMLPAAVCGAEGPFCELGTCAYYLLYQLAKTKKCDLFSGLGVDELFAGYITYKADRFRNSGNELSEEDKKINHLLWGDKGFTYESPSYINELNWQKQLFSADAFSEIGLNNCLSEAFFNRRAIDRDLDVIDRRSYIDFKLRLMDHKNFHIASKMSRGYHMRTHYPFLDNEILDLVCQLPLKMRLKGSTDKYVIRQAAKKYLPSPILERKKITLVDFTYTEVLEHLIKKFKTFFSYEYIEKNGLFSYDFINGIIERLQEPKSALDRFREKNIILTVLTLCVFMDTYDIKPF
jgi:asparagine synthase (glutamine-hydrolysing)